MQCVSTPCSEALILIGSIPHISTPVHVHARNYSLIRSSRSERTLLSLIIIVNASHTVFQSLVLWHAYESLILLPGDEVLASRWYQTAILPSPLQVNDLLKNKKNGKKGNMINIIVDYHHPPTSAPSRLSHHTQTIISPKMVLKPFFPNL